MGTFGICLSMHITEDTSELWAVKRQKLVKNHYLFKFLPVFSSLVKEAGLLYLARVPSTT